LKKGKRAAKVRGGGGRRAGGFRNGFIKKFGFIDSKVDKRNFKY